MSSSKETKVELSLDIADAARFFRIFADGLEGGDKKPLTEYGVYLLQNNKIKIGLKRSPDAIFLKIKLKTSEQVSGSEDITPHVASKENITDYKSLKKRMAKSFKNIKKSLQAGNPPVAYDLSIFFEDSKNMLTYSGKGDRFYPAYAEACNLFKKTIKGHNLDEMLDALQNIDKIKSACHNRYK